MKKLIALTLMVACLACFTLGCPDKKPPAPAPSTTSQTGGDEATPDDAPAVPAAPAAPATE